MQTDKKEYKETVSNHIIRPHCSFVCVGYNEFEY